MPTQHELDRLHEGVPPDYYQRGVRKNFFQQVWHGGRKAQAEKILRGIPARKLLDLGCHGGYFTHILADITHAETWGVDVSAPAIAYAHAQYPHIHFAQHDIQKPLPFPDESFDVITTFDVLEHVPDVAAVIHEAHRLLTRDGSFIVGIALERNVLFKAAWALWKLSRGKVWSHVHVHQFSLQSFRDLMRDTGFVEGALLRSHWGTYITVRYTKHE